jgi:hypothetical protein
MRVIRIEYTTDGLPGDMMMVHPNDWATVKARMETFYTGCLNDAHLLADRLAYLEDPLIITATSQMDGRITVHSKDVTHLHPGGSMDGSLCFDQVYNATIYPKFVVANSTGVRTRGNWHAAMHSLQNDENFASTIDALAAVVTSSGIANGSAIYGSATSDPAYASTYHGTGVAIVPQGCVVSSMPMRWGSIPLTYKQRHAVAFLDKLALLDSAWEPGVQTYSAQKVIGPCSYRDGTYVVVTTAYSTAAPGLAAGSTLNWENNDAASWIDFTPAIHTWGTSFVTGWPMLFGPMTDSFYLKTPVTGSQPAVPFTTEVNDGCKCVTYNVGAVRGGIELNAKHFKFMNSPDSEFPGETDAERIRRKLKYAQIVDEDLRFRCSFGSIAAVQADVTKANRLYETYSRSVTAAGEPDEWLDQVIDASKGVTVRTINNRFNNNNAVSATVMVYAGETADAYDGGTIISALLQESGAWAACLLDVDLAPSGKVIFPGEDSVQSEMVVGVMFENSANVYSADDFISAYGMIRLEEGDAAALAFWNAYAQPALPPAYFVGVEQSDILDIVGCADLAELNTWLDSVEIAVTAQGYALGQAYAPLGLFEFDPRQLSPSGGSSGYPIHGVERSQELLGMRVMFEVDQERWNRYVMTAVGTENMSNIARLARAQFRYGMVSLISGADPVMVA